MIFAIEISDQADNDLRNIIVMRQDETDRRKQRIIITDDAVRTIGKYENKGSKFREKMFEMVASEELETAIKVITQLQAFLKQYQQEEKNE